MFTCTDTRDAENAFEGVGSGGCNEKLTANLHNEDCLFCQSQIDLQRKYTKFESQSWNLKTL